MAWKLRDYQRWCLDKLYAWLNNNILGNPLLCLPTGTGKANIIASICHELLDKYPAMKIMMCVHSKTLVDQNAKRLKRLWPDAPIGIYAAGLKKKQSSMPITFASIQSAVKHPEDFGVQHVLLVDEAHMISDKEGTSYQILIDALKKKNPKLRVIGLTATPFRLKTGRLVEGGLFTDVAFDATGYEAFNWFLDNCYLKTLIPFPTDTEFELGKLRTLGGEFRNDDVQKAMDKEALTRAAIEEALHKASDRDHWLVFTTGIEHAENVAAMLRAYGEEAAAYHSKMTTDEQEKVMADFLSGKLRMLVNADMLTTGFDFPEIDCIIMLRPTKSVGLHIQMLGRGTRPVYAFGFDLDTLAGRMAAMQASGIINCLVLDYAKNTSRLGPINDPRIPGEKGKKTGEIPIKLCETKRIVQPEIGPMVTGCGAYNHAAARTCCACKATFMIGEALIDTEASKEEIVKKKKTIDQTVNVDMVHYALSPFRPNTPRSVKVEYRFGMQRAYEYVCLEHAGKSRILAEVWWRKRFSIPCPANAAEAVAYITNNENIMPEVTQIVVALKDRAIGDGRHISFNVAKKVIFKHEQKTPA